MKQSIDRILTTHTGSLPRPPDMLGLLVEEQQQRLSERAQLEDSVRAAVRDVFNRQVETGLDVVNDGEQGRVDYTVYVKDRLTGYEGENVPLGGMTSDVEFPELAELLKPFASPFQVRPTCTGPIEWMDWPAVETDIENLRAACRRLRYRGRGRGSLYDIPVTGPDCPLPAQRVLRHRRGVHLRPGRGDEAAV